MKKIVGFSIAELLICLCIGSVLLNTGVPALVKTMQNNQQAQLVNQLIGTLQFARGNAVIGKSTVGICTGTDNCNSGKVWSSQLLVFHDPNQNGKIDRNERLMRQEQLPPGYEWYWSNFRNRNFLQFAPDGTTRALNGTLTLCRKNVPLRQIVINVTGRVRTQSPKQGALCG